MAENIFRLIDEVTSLNERLRRSLEDLVGTVTSSPSLKLSKHPIAEQFVASQEAPKVSFPEIISVAMPKMPTINLEPVKVKKAKGPVSDARKMQGQWMAALRYLTPEEQLEAKRMRFVGGPAAFVEAIEWAKSKRPAKTVTEE